MKYIKKTFENKPSLFLLSLISFLFMFFCVCLLFRIRRVRRQDHVFVADGRFVRSDVVVAGMT
jgi:hypothetical protein